MNGTREFGSKMLNLWNNMHIQSDQKVSVHLMITIQQVGAQRIFDHPVHVYIHSNTPLQIKSEIYRDNYRSDRRDLRIRIR
jgi:hypothetical protein